MAGLLYPHTNRVLVHTNEQLGPPIITMQRFDMHVVQCYVHISINHIAEEDIIKEGLGIIYVIRIFWIFSQKWVLKWSNIRPRVGADPKYSIKV